MPDDVLISRIQSDSHIHGFQSGSSMIGHGEQTRAKNSFRGNGGPHLASFPKRKSLQLMTEDTFDYDIDEGKLYCLLTSLKYRQL